MGNWRSQPGASPAMRLTMELVPAERLTSEFFQRPIQTAMAFSPDGNTLVFSGTRGSGAESRRLLYRRTLDQSDAVPIPGTEGASGPFFSPDGKWVGFSADGKLKKIPMSGGPVVGICDMRLQPWGATWGSADVIVFAAGFATGDLMQVPAASGTPQTVIQPDRVKGERFASPAFLPDGKTLLFTVRTSDNWDEAQIIARRLDNGGRRVLVKGGADARYSPTGHLLYLLKGALMAVPFDVQRLETTGTPAPMLDGVMQAVNMPRGDLESGLGQFAVSHSGTLVYASGGIYPARHTTLVRVDRHGVVTDLQLPNGNAVGLRVSPDGQRVLTHRLSETSRLSDVWAFDLFRSTAARLTTQGNNWWPLWSPDGKRILFRGGPGETQILSMLADGQGAIETIATGKGRLTPASWSPDGRWLAYLVGNLDSTEIWVRPMSGPGEPKRFVESKFVVSDPQFSPDGRWMAYSSDESPIQVYVQAFPNPGEKHRISTDRGSNPAWARDGREVFYLNGSSMMAVDIASGTQFHAATPRTLFVLEGLRAGYPAAQLRRLPRWSALYHRAAYPFPDQRVTKLNVALNWFEELKRRAPRGSP